MKRIITIDALRGFALPAFWMGNILSIYATLGLVLIFCWKLCNRCLLFWNIFFSLTIPNKLWEMVNYSWIHYENRKFSDEAGKQYLKVASSRTVW